MLKVASDNYDELANSRGGGQTRANWLGVMAKDQHYHSTSVSGN